MAIDTLEKPQLARGMQHFIDELDAKGGKPLYTLTPEEARQVLITTQDAYKVDLPDVEIKDMKLDVGPTGQVGARLVKPRGAKGKLPCIFYVHGAGWVMGGIHTHDRLVRELCVASGMAIMIPDYSLAPESQYPVPMGQSDAVMGYTAKHAQELGLDAGGFVIAGDSVGGLMATVLAMMAKEREGPKITGQILLYPVADAGMNTKSYTEFADGPWLTKKAMAYFWDKYLPDVSRRKERNASPLQASVADLKGLPPAFIITNQNDVLRDEAEAYAVRLDEAGVEVANVRMNGVIHDFMLLNAVAKTPETKAAVLMASAAARKAAGLAL